MVSPRRSDQVPLAIHGTILLQWLPVVPASWCSYSCVISPHSLCVGWTKWLASNEQTITKMMKCHFQDSVVKNCDFHLVCTLSLWLFLLYHSDEANCHVVSCPPERPMWQETGQQPERNWDPQSNPQGTESCQQPHVWAWKQILPQSHLGMTAALLTPWLQLVRDLEPKDPVKPRPQTMR